MRFFQHVGVASLLAYSVQAAVSSTGFTVSLTDIDYFLPPKPVASIAGCDEIKPLFEDGLFVPITVITESVSDLASIIATYAAKDDVWQEGFLEALYVQGSSKPVNVLGTILSGAFTESAISKGDGSYSVLPAGAVGQKQAIAVSSRLYFTKSAEKPLAGVRIGIKDIYDIKGLRTSNGNRAWYWLYPPASNTAPPVQNLIDAGAVIVGKMLTSQFANGETATADWVDYHEAFNPRGDGYQDTSSSSSGGGAGAAAYAWLDVTLGSDTGGSVRSPSHVQGVYGNRPSHGLVSLDHTMPLSPLLDTPGLLARNPILWKEAAQAMYKANITTTNAYPTRIQTLSWPTSASTVADQLLVDFLAKVTDFLGANATAYNVTAAFSEDNPDLAPLTTIMNLTYAMLIMQQIELVREPFYADYAAEHDGRLPFVDPVPLTRWGWGDNQTITIDEAIANKTIFMTWANETFLAPSAETCSESLIMYVGSTGSTVYRNKYLDEPSAPPLGFSDGRISVMSEAPDFVVPIGEAPYNSTITGHVEYLPVTANFMAAKGCDGMLFSLIGDLYEAGILKESLSGRSGVTGGEILFRRGLYEY